MGSAKKGQHITVQIAKNFKNIDVSLLKLKELVRTICKRFKLLKATVSIAIVDELFELVVNGEMAVRQAKLQGHSSEAELALYITHSLLHNLGFDDSTGSQSKIMHDTENEILQQLGYGLIYNY